MQELVGRLTALDPEATETLKVITYFDVLVNGHAGAEVLLRGAATLSGCAAGMTHGRVSQRVNAAGARSVSSSPVGWPSRSFGDGGLAWIEREGPAHTNDEMILERLALALGIVHDRRSPETASSAALQSLIDPDASIETRLKSASRLHLSPESICRMVASPAGDHVNGPSVVIGTRAGAIRASLHGAFSPVGFARVGIGFAGSPDTLAASWTSALTALRLTSAHEPVVRSDDVEALILLVEAADRASDAGHDAPADVTAVAGLVHSHPGALELLESVARGDSHRTTASGLGLHHSTIQARVAGFSDALGFDLGVAQGRTRLTLALALHRSRSNRFE